MARILIVEDVAELREELRRAVDAEHDVFGAASAAEASSFLHSSAVDLVITAMVLETGDYTDGLGVVRSVTARNPAARAIVVTSYSTPEMCVKAIRAGVFDYIERNSPGINFFEVLRWKIRLAVHSAAPAAAS
jgi:DNA-binding NtrC family response regulator